jgi:hypothetical protein
MHCKNTDWTIYGKLNIIFKKNISVYGIAQQIVIFNTQRQKLSIKTAAKKKKSLDTVLIKVA